MIEGKIPTNKRGKNDIGLVALDLETIYQTLYISKIKTIYPTSKEHVYICAVFCPFIPFLYKI
jgi:hypothetical protein